MGFAREQSGTVLSSPDYTPAANIPEPLSACITHMQKYEVYFMGRKNELGFFLRT